MPTNEVPVDGTLARSSLHIGGKDCSERKIPEGYAAVPLTEAMADAAVRVCVLAAEKPEPSGALVVLRQNRDARILLGCMIDGGGNVLDWLEIWIQQTGGESNDRCDARWRDVVHALKVCIWAPAIDVGTENGGMPCWIDCGRAVPVHPVNADGARWQVCRDNALLERFGLPPFSADRNRYLWIPEFGEESPLACAQLAVAPPEGVGTLEDNLDGMESPFPLNPAGEGIAVRPLVACSWNSYVTALENGSFPNLRHGRRTLSSSAEVEKDALLPEMFSTPLFSGKGDPDRLVEVLHIKLTLLCGMIRQVWLAAREMGRPFLNLSPASFRVDVRRTHSPLPALWTAMPILTDMGCARQVDVEGGQGRLFHAPETDGRTYSIYQPENRGKQVKGTGDVRIRDVAASASGTIQITGTLVCREQLASGHGYILYFPFQVNASNLWISATIKAEDALADGEFRFVSLPQSLPLETVATLETMAGIPVSGVEFAALPVSGAAVDLYSLGVMAVELFLTSEERLLPHAVDELFSLAKEAAADSGTLEAAIRGLMTENSRWFVSLGPGCVAETDCPSEEALERIGAGLWSSVLALLIRLFPGLSRESYALRCEGSAGEIPHRLFDRPLKAAAELVVQSRRPLIRETAADRILAQAVKTCIAKRKNENE